MKKTVIEISGELGTFLWEPPQNAQGVLASLPEFLRPFFEEDLRRLIEPYLHLLIGLILAPSVMPIMAPELGDAISRLCDRSIEVMHLMERDLIDPTPPVDKMH